MPQPRFLVSSLLATSLVASAAFVLPAIGQSHPTTPNPAPLAATITNPQLFSTNSLPSTFSYTLPKSAQPNSFHFDSSKPKDNPAIGTITVGKPFRLSKDDPKIANITVGKPFTLSKEATRQLLDREIKSLSAQSNVPCYKLRSYNFTARDLKSPHPHSSSETDCTPATSAHLKEIQLPAAQSPAVASSALQIITGSTTAK